MLINAPAHKSVVHVAMAAVCDCGFELVDHPPLFSWFGTIWLFSVPQHELKKNHCPGETGLPWSVFYLGCSWNVSST